MQINGFTVIPCIWPMDAPHDYYYIVKGSNILASKSLWLDLMYMEDDEDAREDYLINRADRVMIGEFRYE